jgi:hypothetical protein
MEDVERVRRLRDADVGESASVNVVATSKIFAMCRT